MKTLFVVIVGLALAAPAVADSPTWSQLGSPENRWGGTSVAFSSDGAMLASNLGSTVVLWDGREPKPVGHPARYVLCPFRDFFARRNHAGVLRG